MASTSSLEKSPPAGPPPPLLAASLSSSNEKVPRTPPPKPASSTTGSTPPAPDNKIEKVSVKAYGNGNGNGNGNGHGHHLRQRSNTDLQSASLLSNLSSFSEMTDLNRAMSRSFSFGKKSFGLPYNDGTSGTFEDGGDDGGHQNYTISTFVKSPLLNSPTVISSSGEMNMVPSTSSKIFSIAEDKRLYELIENGEQDWAVISKALGRTEYEVFYRWNRELQPAMKEHADRLTDMYIANERNGVKMRGGVGASWGEGSATTGYGDPSLLLHAARSFPPAVPSPGQGYEAGDKVLTPPPSASKAVRKTPSSSGKGGKKGKPAAAKKVNKSPKHSSFPPGQKVKGAWTVAEDKIITDYIEAQNLPAGIKFSQWTALAGHLTAHGHYRVGKQVRERYKNLLDPTLRTGDFTHQEDVALWRLWRVHGSKWVVISREMGNRSENSIKNRFNSKGFGRKREGWEKSGVQTPLPQPQAPFQG